MNLFENWGVIPIINASGTVTRLGGAPLPEAVMLAMWEAARESVPIEQLQAAASRRISTYTGTEAALVTSGSAAGLTLGTAALLAGLNLARMEQLPQVSNFPNEFIVAREQRNGYDHAVRAAGAKLVEVGCNEVQAGAGVRRTETWEYVAAFGPQTAGVFYVSTPDAQPPLADLVQAPHAHGLPVLVDAAGQLPPRSQLKDIPATGADLVVFSGGKGIRGPQSTGILCGRREWIASAALQMLDMDDHWELWEPPTEFLSNKNLLPGMPRHGLGRGFTVSKAEIAALLTALDLFVSGAYLVDRPRFLQCLEIISNPSEYTTEIYQ